MKKEKHCSTPPKWAIRFLEWFCPEEFFEGILGDVLEQYEGDRESYTTSRANRRFVWNILRFFHPSIILRNHLTINLLPMGMFKSHLLVVLRSMKKYKFYASINILGLSLAIGFVFLAFLFIQNELSIDQFHTQKDHIYRIYHKKIKAESGEVSSVDAVTAIPLSRDLKAEIPAIKQYTRHGSSSGTVIVDEQPYAEVITYVDPAFLTMFDFPFMIGDKFTALDDPSSVILSIEQAEKYFGDIDPIGKSLIIEMSDSAYIFQVSGVIDAKFNASSIQFGILLPFEQYKMSVPSEMFDSYKYGIVENYVLMDKVYPKDQLEALMTQAIEKFSPSREVRIELGLQPLASIYLDDKVVGNAKYTSPSKLYIMTALTFLVMLIAAINFITLSTSHGLSRIKEMGMRKTLGALKSHLRNHLALEAIFITLISGFIGLMFAYLAAPVFAELTESTMTFSFNLTGLLFLLTLIILVGTITGLFQAVLLVKYNAIQALKGNMLVSGHTSWINQGLVVLQFSLSVLLVIGAVNMRSQMQYIQHKDLGFEEERLLEISMGGSENIETANFLLERFKTKSQQNNRILNVSASMNNAREPWTELIFEQEDGTTEGVFYNQIDPSYLQTMNIELIKGTGFPEGATKEYNGILVNEALVKHFGWEDPLNEQIPGKNLKNNHRIVGVVKDFHFSSLHQKIEPIVLALNVETLLPGVTGLSTYIWPPNLYQLEVRFSPGEIQQVIDHLKNVWQDVNPNKDFVYHFVDEVLEAQYAEEKRWAKIINMGSIFAIVIAWLGLLGLMRLAMQKRTKEIGIRKVLGSSTLEIILLLSQRFLLLVALGIVIAWPIGWILMEEWLQSFVYRIPLNPLWFLAAGLGVLSITIISVGVQALQTARANPVEALRFE